MSEEIVWPTPEQWAKKLETTAATQGTSRLFDVREQSYCCLGILADMADPQGWDNSGDWRGFRTQLGYHLSPQWLSSRQQDTATYLNDDGKLSFPEIAVWVREGMPVLRGMAEVLSYAEKIRNNKE